MPGKVYCFNCYNEPINQLIVNGLSAGRLSGWSASGLSLYTPASLVVARARHGDGQSAPVFSGDRPTALRIDWDSYTVQTSIDVGRLPNISLDDDLILYIAVNQLTLMSTRGFVLSTTPTSPRGE